MTSHKQNLRRTRIGLVATVASSAMLLAGCQAGGDTQNDATDGELSGTVTVWSWNAPAAGLEAAVPAFEELHPDVEVKVEDVGNPAIWDKITTGMAAGGAGLADVLNIGIDYMGNYVETFPDGLVDLAEYGAGDLAEDFPSGVWASGSAGDKVFGIPYETNTSAFYYRTDLFEQAGVDAEAIETWDALIDAGVALKEKTGSDLFAIDKAAKTPDADTWQLLTSLGGGFYFDEAGDITMNGEAGVAALDFLKRANDAGIVADLPAGWDTFLLSAKGQANVAVIPYASWAAGIIADEAPDMEGKWGVRRPPAMTEGGLTGAVTGATYLSVSNASPNKAAAAAFIEFALGTEEGQQLVYDGGGLFPGFEPMWETDGFVEPMAYFGGTEANQLFIDQLTQETPALNYTSDYARALKAYSDAQTQVLLSGADPHEALDAAAEMLASQTGRKIAE